MPNQEDAPLKLDDSLKGIAWEYIAGNELYFYNPGLSNFPIMFYYY
jgi:hypothetical protein